MTTYDVIVVGGGPAGLMAAGQAALGNQRVLLLEKMESPGRKLLLTGKGRCNLSNTASVSEALDHFNPGGRFLTQLFYRFYTTELRSFLADLGLPTMVQRGGRVFPESEMARDVLNTLLSWNRNLGVEIQTRVAVTNLILESNQAGGVKSEELSFFAPRIILATGGKGYPGTGSSGEGYQLAQEAGHRIIPVLPALVPLVTAGNTASKLQGLGLKNVTASLWLDGRMETDLFGELLFTHFGLSGPVILSLSRRVVLALENSQQVEIQIDLKPALDHPTLDARLLRDIHDLGKKEFASLLTGLLPKKMIPTCLEETGIPGDKKNSQISAEERKTLRSWLKDNFVFDIIGHRGFEQAIITAGGVDTAEVDPSSMESKLVQGLYFAGEILDLDADTGGFNLQAAFSTGWAAGRAACV
jgi:predicted Rossmann fold flavoprotein